MNAYTVRPGDKVYFDSIHGGLVPAVLVGVTTGDTPATTKARLRLTADRGAYGRGEHWVTNALSIVSRDSVTGLRSTSGPCVIGETRVSAEGAS